MKAFIFNVLGVASAVGLFFLIPAAVFLVPVVAIPLFFAWLLYRFFDEKVETYTTVVSSLPYDKIQEYAVRARFVDGAWDEPGHLSSEIRERVECLVDQLPMNTNCTVTVNRVGKENRVRLTTHSEKFHVNAVGGDEDILIAYEKAEAELLKQWGEFQKRRFEAEPRTREYGGLRVVGPNEKISAIPRVLIVDDDVDAALLVDSVFKNKGCQTDLAFSVEEAKSQISKEKADVIILDWQLSDSVSADQILEELAERWEATRDKNDPRKLKVVTYSARQNDEIHFPKSRYFDHIDHWKKPTSFRELNDRSLGVLEAASF